MWCYRSVAGRKIAKEMAAAFWASYLVGGALMSKRSQLAVACVAVTGWYVLACLRLIPPQSLLTHFSSPAYHAWAFSHLSYSDIFSLYQRHRLANHAWPYIQTPIEYPVVMGMTMWVTAWVPHPLGFFLSTALMLWIAAMLTTAALMDRSFKAGWAFALSPLLLTYGLLNWDVLGIFFMVWALKWWERQQYDKAAVLFAIAVFFKFFPVFYLPFLALKMHMTGRRRALLRSTMVFFGVALLLNVPFAWLNWRNWSLFFSFNASRQAAANVWTNPVIHVSSVPLVDALSLTVVVTAAALASRAVWRGASLYRAAASLFSVFLVVNKVFSPQYMIWLLVFGVLADWPESGLGLLSLAGVVDYVNSLTILHWARSNNHAAFIWYGREVFPLGLVVRYGAIVLAWISGQGRITAEPLLMQASDDIPTGIDPR